jgi:hypothetical protein
MAAKAKSKAKPTAKKAVKKTSKPRVNAQSVPNHRFEPGTKVGIFPAHEISVERGLGREPIPKPTKTATVKKDGSLSVSGLKAGSYLAAAQVGEGDDAQYLYVQFSVK